jgi:hypothetical protein
MAALSCAPRVRFWPIAATHRDFSERLLLVKADVQIEDIQKRSAERPVCAHDQQVTWTYAQRLEVLQTRLPRFAKS